MSNQYVFNDRLPLAPLKIAALESCRDLAQKVNDHIVNSVSYTHLTLPTILRV